MNPLLEHLIVGLVVFGAMVAAARKWWPSKKRPSGCGGCNQCGGADDTGCATSPRAPAPAEHRTVAMPQRQRPAR